MRFSDIQKVTRPVVSTCQHFDCKVKLRYYPAVFTPDFEERVANLVQSVEDDIPQIKTLDKDPADMSDEEIEGLEAIRVPPKRIFNHTVELLTPLIADWDLLDDNDKPCPIDQKFMSGVPYPMLYCFMRDIQQDMRPNDTPSSL